MGHSFEMRRLIFLSYASEGKICAMNGDPVSFYFPTLHFHEDFFGVK
jgi:hypothetical protein